VYIFFLLKDFIDSFKDTFSVISTHDPQQLAHEIYRQQIMQRIPGGFSSKV